MRSYLEITAHFAGKEVAQPAGKKKFSSLLLKFRRFVGSHTGESIGLAFEQALEEFEIKNKVTCGNGQCCKHESSIQNSIFLSGN